MKSRRKDIADREGGKQSKRRKEEFFFFIFDKMGQSYKSGMNAIYKIRK